MTHIKCSQCGLNNWGGAQVCERCGASLDHNQSLDHSQVEPVLTPRPQPDFPVLLTLGGSASTHSKTLKAILAVIITLVVGGGAWAVYIKNRGKEPAGKRKQLVERTVDERTRDAVLSCLAQPGFVGTKVSEQVLGPVHLEMWQVPEGRLWLSAPADRLRGTTPALYRSYRG